MHMPLFLHGLDEQNEAVVFIAAVVLSVVVATIVVVVVPAGMILQNIPL